MTSIILSDKSTLFYKNCNMKKIIYCLKENVGYTKYIDYFKYIDTFNDKA